jgi:hypothetical protein
VFSSRHPSLQDNSAPRQLLWFEDPDVPLRACCCPAQPVVKVTMPPAPGRDHPVDLWLCGHHYRVSLKALHAAGVTAADVTFTDSPETDDRVAVPA